VCWEILSTLTLSRQNVRSLMNGMKEKDMWKRVFNETYAKQFWTDIRHWFTLCRPTSTDSTSPIQIGRDLELKRPRRVNRNKVRKSHKKPCWWAHFFLRDVPKNLPTLIELFSGIFEPIFDKSQKAMLMGTLFNTNLFFRHFWTDIRRWFTLCRPTSTDSTSTIR